MGGVPGMANSGYGCPCHEYPDEDFDRVVAVNLGGAFRCAKYALPHLMLSAGSIVNIASTFGMTGAANTTAYGSSKGGVIQLTRVLAKEYGKHSVRCNAICPGYIDNDMARRGRHLTREAAEKVVAAREAAAALQPAGRQGGTDEVARSVVFLASAQSSSFVTGAILP